MKTCSFLVCALALSAGAACLAMIVDNDAGAAIARPVLRDFANVGEQFSFRFLAEPGYDYFVEYREASSAASWLALTNTRVKLQETDILITDSTTNSPARIYRVRKEDCQCD